MFFQAILCVSVPQARRAEMDRTGKWQLRAPSVYVGWGECDLLSHPEPYLECQKDTMEGGCALQELMLLERQHLSSVFCRTSLIAGEWWYQGFGVSSQHHYKAAVFCLSSGSFLFVFPLRLQSGTVSGLSSPVWWFLSALSHRADFLPSSSQIPLALPSTYPSPSVPQNQQMERCMATLKEGRKHPERSMMSTVHPVPMTAGKCVFCFSFHRETHYVLRVVCCQPSTNHFSEVCNLAKLAADYPGHSKRYISDSKAPSWQISSL